MPDTAISPRQSQVLAIIREHCACGQPCPSYVEIGQRLGITKQTVAGHLAALERKGLLDHDPASHRSIRIADKSQVMTAVEPVA